MTFNFERRLGTFKQFNWPHSVSKTGAKNKYKSQPEDVSEENFPFSSFLIFYSFQVCSSRLLLSSIAGKHGHGGLFSLLKESRRLGTKRLCLAGTQVTLRCLSARDPLLGVQSNEDIWALVWGGSEGRCTGSGGSRLLSLSQGWWWWYLYLFSVWLGLGRLGREWWSMVKDVDEFFIS